MVKNKKRLCTIVLVVVLGSAILACGGGTPPPPTPVPPTPTPAATPTPSASDHMDRGREYAEQGELDKAVAEFQAAIELEPDNASAHRNLGTVYFRQGKWEEAAAAYEKAIQLKPDFGGAYGDLAGAYAELGRLSEAVAAGEKAIELAPDYAMAHNNLGVAYYRQDRVDEAIAELKEAIRLDPDFAMAHKNLGRAYRQQGRLDEAVAELQEAIRLDPHYADAHFELGMVYCLQDKFDEAIAEWKEVIKIEPDHATAHYNLGLVYRDRGRAEEAIAEFETYLQLRPDAPDRATVEQDIAGLKESAMAAGAEEYRNVEGGYGLLYPEGWYYEETGTQVEFAENEESLKVAGEETVGMQFNVGPLADFAEHLGFPADTADPVVVWEALADLLGAEGEEIETFKIEGYPAAASDVSGTYDDTPFGGAMAVVLVEERLLYGIAVAPPDQWEAFRPTFVHMVKSLSFFEPDESSAPPAPDAPDLMFSGHLEGVTGHPMASDGKRLWLAVQSLDAPSTVLRIDPTTQRVEQTIKLGMDDFVTALTSDGQQLWVAIERSGQNAGETVHSLDPETGELSGPLGVGGGPLAHDGTLLWVGKVGAVWGVDTDNADVVAIVPLDDGTASSEGRVSAITFGGARLWVFNARFYLLQSKQGNRVYRERRVAVKEGSDV